jgi:hypothetical protein
MSTSHEIVNIGSATRSDRTPDDGDGGGRGTLFSFMSSSIISFSLLSTSATGTTVRAIWVVALALVALAFIDRMKPATQRRTATVRVDNKPTPLYKEPERQQRWRALANLSGGAVIVGALVACLVAFLLAIVLELVGGLLQA